MANEKTDRIACDYVRSELEFLSTMKVNEPVIAIISEHITRLNDAVNWLNQKLGKKVIVAGASLSNHFPEFLKKLAPDILIGDSLKALLSMMGEKPLGLIRNGGYIYFVESSRGHEIREWLRIDNRGQHLVDVWIKLNQNQAPLHFQ
ncbi:hypothetical protein G3O08_01575 [Cryomorpha ignava]|uniref:Uncharacterized protein n=1 Tax=Cryomorpha ignava TaxID=101383 RepID=A0A7K3WMT7_9FLAO|nr:hypothetical protein [Cryomorpha ignava]NEN22192.1 hypothetical protein [Cryomorpha ignava]